MGEEIVNSDGASTIAGGAAGMVLLLSVRWELVGVSWGESIKVGVAILLALVGYLAYHEPVGYHLTYLLLTGTEPG